jgi:Mrp family chromosome partitioning ATPase
MTPTRMVQFLSEEETKLLDAVFLGSPAPKAVTFTAPERHSGCSWLVSRIAQRLAQRVGEKVCVVDANFHWPSLHSLFGIQNERGLIQATMRAGDPLVEFSQRISETNLWVIPSGGPLKDSNDILSSDNMKRRIAEVAREFDYVLIDTPALKPCADSGIIGCLTDGIVLVIAANSTKRDTAVNSKMILEAAHIPILGAVLNRRTFPIPDSVYQYL